MKGYTALGLGAEEPSLPQTAKAPQKGVSNCLDPVWGTSKDFRMKEVVGRSRGHAESTSAAAPRQPSVQMAECRQNEGQTGGREEGSLDICPGPLRSSLTAEDSSVAQHHFSGFAFAARGM